MKAIPVFIMGLYCLSHIDVAAENLNLSDDVFSESYSVITPTKLKQSKHDAPSSITVISGQELESLGITQLEEAMRLVPGMRVSKATGWDYRIGYHGMGGGIPRRMNVLIDGVSVYRHGIARVEWFMLPVAIEDVERIEVVRSPSAASYGSNSFTAVVNIITKHSIDRPPLVANYQADTQNLRRAYGNASTSIGKSDLSFSVMSVDANGYDRMLDDFQESGIPKAHDSSEKRFVRLASHTPLNGRSDLIVNASFSKAELEEALVLSEQDSFPDIEQEAYSVDAKLEYELSPIHSMAVTAAIDRSVREQDFRACLPSIYFTDIMLAMNAANPDYAQAIASGEFPTGGTPEDDQLVLAVLQRGIQLELAGEQELCVGANQDFWERKSSFSVEDQWVFNDKFRMFSEIKYQENKFRSETHTGPSPIKDDLWQFFANAELRPWDKTTFNFGFMYEQSSNTDNYQLSPRLGLNYHMGSHTLRVLYSEAERLPDVLETDLMWNYYTRDWDRQIDGRTEGPVFRTVTTNGSLDTEKNSSYELSLYGSIPQTAIEYDIKYFVENVEDTISERLEFSDPGTLTNENAVDLKGLEWELRYVINPTLTLRAGYSYINNDATTRQEKTLQSDHAGFANITYRTTAGQFSLAYYGNSKMTDESFQRWDFNYQNRLDLDQYNVKFRLGAQFYNFDVTAYPATTRRGRSHRYDDDLNISFGLALEY